MAVLRTVMFDTARKSCHVGGDDNSLRRNGSISHEPQAETGNNGAIHSRWILGGTSRLDKN